MAVLNDPELLHVLRFTDQEGATRILFVIAEKTAWLGEGGFELYATAGITGDNELLYVKRIAYGSEFSKGFFGEGIFGGNRATVYLPDPFPHKESQRKLPELYWFWPTGTLRFVLEPLPPEEYALSTMAYDTYVQLLSQGRYVNIFAKKQLTS